ncbi:MAG: hypothetical protein ACXW3Z_00480 [Limisphaerales bacterium]
MRNNRVTGLVTQHALFWLMVGNGVGLWLALLLLFPELNRLTGEVTYGRWIPVHLNLQLYGWTSLPLVAWLFHLYPAGTEAEFDLARGATLTWSGTLAVAVVSWMLGQNSGKIFLEWEGFPRVLFCFNLLGLWCALIFRFLRSGKIFRTTAFWARLLGLIALGAIIPAWYWASSPAVYPAVNPSSGGPTAGSLLGSTLSVVFLLLIAAPLLGRRTSKGWGTICWSLLVLEMVLVVFFGGGNKTHRSILQFGLLATLLPWPPLLLQYFRCFRFPPQSYWWLKSAIGWFALLTVTGWISFLPDVLDRWKFTNALVAHSHLAMAGFVTCFNLFLLSSLGMVLPSWSGFIWNIATITYVALMWIAGTFEALNPAFTILNSTLRTTLYAGRAVAGLLMFACSLAWWRSSIVQERDRVTQSMPEIETSEVPIAA